MKTKLVQCGLAVGLGGLLVVILGGRRTSFSTAQTLSVSWTPSLRVSAASSLETRTGEAPPQSSSTTIAVILAERKAAMVARINRDYDAIRLSALAEKATHGRRAGGEHTFNRQLKLLERERRKDLVAVLTPRELEDIELWETPAGQLVSQSLGDTHATEDQRREVFRVQRAFELEFDDTRSQTPEAALERERAWQRTQEEVRAVLGDDLFGSWLAGEGQLHAKAVAFATQHGFSPRIAKELRRTRDDYRLRLLELHATQGMLDDQLRATTRTLAQQAEARAVAILGPGLSQTARAELLNWLPQE